MMWKCHWGRIKIKRIKEMRKTKMMGQPQQPMGYGAPGSCNPGRLAKCHVTRPGRSLALSKEEPLVT